MNQPNFPAGLNQPFVPNLPPNMNPHNLQRVRYQQQLSNLGKELQQNPNVNLLTSNLMNNPTLITNIPNPNTIPSSQNLISGIPGDYNNPLLTNMNFQNYINFGNQPNPNQPNPKTSKNKVPRRRSSGKKDF